MDQTPAAPSMTELRKQRDALFALADTVFVSPEAIEVDRESLRVISNDLNSAIDGVRTELYRIVGQTNDMAGGIRATLDWKEERRNASNNTHSK